MQINAYDRTIFQLFTSNNKYIVPRFQRPYCWEQEHVSQLWEDIISNVELENDSYKNNEYFIGSLVLIGESNSDTFQIVDGQQRLTTIVIFLSALIEYYKRVGKEDLAKGIYTLIEGNDFNNKKFFKLINETPKPFFQAGIQNYDKGTLLPSSDEETYLKQAYDLVFDRIIKISKSAESEKKLVDYLNAIRDQITQLKVIFITVDNEDDAYTIFETLNSTGKDLSVTDLIKNAVYRVLNIEHPTDEANDSWKKVSENLNQREKGIDLDQFLLHYWLSKYEHTSKKKLYKSFKKNIPLEINNIRVFLEDLIVESEVYTKISYPLHADWPLQEEREIFLSLRALNVFKVTQCRGLFLALISQRANGNLSLRDFITAIKNIEKFHFLFTAVCSSRPSGLESKYSKYGKSLRQSSNKAESRRILFDLMEDLKSKVPNKSIFIDSFSNIWFTNARTDNKTLIRYIFYNYEKYLRRTNELDVAIFTLEHIAPQSNTSLRDCIGQIGNLLPLCNTINNVASDKPLSDKIYLYDRSQLLTVKEFLSNLGDKTIWEEGDIINRTQHIAEVSYGSIWTLSN